MRSTIAVVLFLSAATAAGQTSSASVVGRVTDPTGAVVPAVTAKITNLDTNASRQVSSNEDGDYTIPYLNPGRYALEVTLSGFRSSRRPQVTLEREHGP